MGYAAFVLVPAVAVIALAVYKFGGYDKPNNNPTAQYADDDKDAGVKNPDPPPKRITPRPPRNDKPADVPDDPPPPQPRDTSKKDDPVTPDPVPKSEPITLVAIAPEPPPARVMPEVTIPEPVAIAPEPHVARPGFAPPPGFTSEWEQVDEVEARVAGVAIMHVPIIDADGRAVNSAVAVLTIWVEVRTQTKARTVELKRWQDAFGSYADVATARGLQLGRALLGPGASLRTGLPYKQVVPPDGTPRTEIVVFAAPPDDPGDLHLSLDAERVGEKGKFKITIPAKALKK